MAVSRKNNTAAAADANKRVVLDCSVPVKDGIFDLAAFENFVNGKFKVGGKTGNLAGKITITRDSSANKLSIQSQSAAVTFSKSYLKFLTKKFLKKNQLRDYLHVVATDRASYQLKYYNVDASDSASDE